MCICLYGCTIYDENPIGCIRTQIQTHEIRIHTHHYFVLVRPFSWFILPFDFSCLFLCAFFSCYGNLVPSSLEFCYFCHKPFEIRWFRFNGFFIAFKRLVVLFCQNMQYFLRQNLCLDTPLLLLLTMYCVIAIHCIKILPLSCAVFAANKVHGLKWVQVNGKANNERTRTNKRANEWIGREWVWREEILFVHIVVSYCYD